MKRHTLWSVALLSGLLTSLLSAQHARGQTTVVYSPPVYQTTYYSPTTAYYPAYPAYRTTFFGAFFGRPAGYYYPAYYYPTTYYRVRTRRSRRSYYVPSVYVPTVVGYAPVISSTGDCTTCSPCATSACPNGQCGTSYDGSSSAAEPQKKVPVPDGKASRSDAGKPRTYSEQKPPLPAAKSKSPDKGSPGTGTKKSEGLPPGDSDFKPTSPGKKKSGDAPASPGPDTSAAGNPRKIEARKLAPPIVIQPRKDKRPPVTEPAGDETDPFGGKTAKPGTTDSGKSRQPGTASPGKKPAKPGAGKTDPTAKIQPLHLDGRVVWRTAPRRTRLSVRAARFGTPTVDRAFRSNRGWTPVPNGNRVAGP